ncbi:head GIN domain-containing protein [uncultured Chitinophaga sp.]|uniref:head GIN domain-containing protein n=1 Tax=uncultured Chitinophaga sp. TaxID=339340 RepID=UPI0025FC95EA|nr:head GIN domain-containing protein [uncultured Chitinophaga sp.]
MRTSLLSLLLCAALAPTLTGCDEMLGHEKIKGNGNVVKQTRQTARFDQLELKGNMDVYIRQGEQQEVVVEIDENIQPYIILEENEGELEIKQKDNTSLRTNRATKVYITVADLRLISLSGSGNININGKFVAGDKLAFSLSGSGNIKSDELDAPRIEADMAGSGDISLKGNTREVKVDIAGSADFHGTDLLAENAEVNIAGSGDAHVYASMRVTASIAGSGDVRYRGDAIATTSSVVGSGSLRKE